MIDYYYILGVPENATIDTIKKSFREKAKQYHPDINKQANAAEQFRTLFEAYEFLSDTHKRSVYDQTRTSKREDDAVASAEFKQWKHHANDEAQRYSQMPYEQFIKCAIFEVTFAVKNFTSLYTGVAMTFGGIVMLIVSIQVHPLLALMAIPWLIIGPQLLKGYSEERKEARAKDLG